MTLSKEVGDREFQKFEEDENLNTAVRVTGGVLIKNEDGDYLDVIERHSLPKGLVAYTEPYRKGAVTVKFYTNETYGFEMAQNGEYAGTPDKIHNGIDDVLWTALAITGTWDFNSAVEQKTGSFSIDATAAGKGDSFIMTRSTPLSLATYQAVSGWIYITGWTAASSGILLNAQLDGVVVGNSVDLEDYVNELLFGVWQKFVIPQEDLGLTLGTETVDEVVIQTIGGAGPAADYYLDDIQWEEATGGGIAFEVHPDPGTIFHAHGLCTFGVSETDSTLLNASHQNISYDKFIGIPQLTAGILSIFVIDGVFTFAGITTSNADFLSIPSTTFTSGGDGTSTWIKNDSLFHEELILDSRTNDFVRIIINDDLSVLPIFRISLIGFIETIVTGEN